MEYNPFATNDWTVDLVMVTDMMHIFYFSRKLCVLATLWRRLAVLVCAYAWRREVRSMISVWPIDHLRLLAHFRVCCFPPILLCITASRIPITKTISVENTENRKASGKEGRDFAFAMTSQLLRVSENATSHFDPQRKLKMKY